MTPAGHPPLTARQREVLVEIVRYVAAHGRPPTLDEVADAMGFGNRSGMLCHVAAPLRLDSGKTIARST